MKIVIPGLTRNPVFAWIPALVPFRVFAGMTRYVVIYGAVYILYLNWVKTIQKMARKVLLVNVFGEPYEHSKIPLNPPLWKGEKKKSFPLEAVS